MIGIDKREQRKLFQRLKRRLKELSGTPMWVGKRGIENIHIDDFAVELVVTYCDIDYVLKKIKELRKHRQN